MVRPNTPARTQEHRKPTKRPASHDLRDQVLFVAFMVAVTLGAIFFVVPVMLQQTRDELALKTRGVDAFAVVVRTWRIPGSARSASTYHSRFSFRLASDASTVIDEASITKSEYYGLQAGARVPIVYDPERASVAEVNIGGRVRRRHPVTENALWGALLFIILAFAWLGCIGSFVAVMRARRSALVRSR